MAEADFDDEALVFQLLSRGLDGVNVVPSLDLNEIEDYPIVVFTLTGGNAIDDSLLYPTAWEYGLDLAVLAEGRTPTRHLARDVYRLVHSWNNVWNGTGIADGYGHATEVRDRAVFTRTNQAAVGARVIAQYNGGFDLQLHAA